jgi:hypothetical protein
MNKKRRMIWINYFQSDTLLSQEYREILSSHTLDPEKRLMFSRNFTKCAFTKCAIQDRQKVRGQKSEIGRQKGLASDPRFLAHDSEAFRAMTRNIPAKMS